MNPSKCHDSDPILDPSSQKELGESLSFSLSLSVSSLLSSPDLNYRIVVRKGVQLCTKHLISKFICYLNLSPSYRAFASNRYNISLPKIIEKEMTNPEWKKAIL